MRRGVQGRAAAPIVTSDVLTLQPARAIRGTLGVPGDKSISHRYAMLGAIAHGTTEITDLAPGADVAATLRILTDLGVRVERTSAGHVRVHGRGLASFRTPAGPLDAANSGTTMRLMTGILAGAPVAATLIGDGSLQRRPMQRVIDPIVAMGGRVQSTHGRPPLSIVGGDLHGIRYDIPVASAQVKSAVLLAGLAASGTTRVHEPAPTRDHTERAFPAFGLRLIADGLSVAVEGGQAASAPSTALSVPGDPSSAAVWAAAAAALPGSSVEITNVLLNPRRIAFLEALKRMGARVELETTGESGREPRGTMRVAHGGHERTTITPDEVPVLIDELPVLAARAALGGGLEVSGASELRVKESDRISALVAGFRRLGVAAEERPDGFVIDGTSPPSGGEADASSDHRLVMAFALVALGARGPTRITGAEVVAVSYPDFARDLTRLTS